MEVKEYNFQYQTWYCYYLAANLNTREHVLQKYTLILVNY